MGVFTWPVSCELISKLYFYVRIHKWIIFCRCRVIVVNWFQNCIFTWGFTREYLLLIHQWLLWIDFKIVFLREDSQATSSRQTHKTGCELISKLYFYVRIHKPQNYENISHLVVNWFQNCIFTWGFTSWVHRNCYYLRLWIDFKIVFLREDSQAWWQLQAVTVSCELISKLYFYVRIHKQLL